MTESLDCKAMQYPQPRRKMTTEALSLKPGDILKCVADCPTLRPMSEWCKNSKEALLWFKQEGNMKRCQVRI